MLEELKSGKSNANSVYKNINQTVNTTPDSGSLVNMYKAK